MAGTRQGWLLTQFSRMASVCLQCEMTSGRMALTLCCAPAFGQPSPDLLTMCLVCRAALASAHQCHPLPQTLSVLKSTPQVRGMHTIIR